jgi:hypothetical protein
MVDLSDSTIAVVGFESPRRLARTDGQHDRRVPAYCSTITLDYRTGRAFVANEGGNRPGDGFTVPIHFIARYARFDSPDVRARAIVARCR